MRIKNKDIAEALGISTTAVSLALNNRPGVSDETRQKVLQMIRDSANENIEPYQTSPTAGRIIVLSVHKKNGLIINEKPFFSELIESVQHEAMAKGFLVAIAHYMIGQDIEQYGTYLTNLKPCGIIVFATEMEQADIALYKNLNIPFVLMDASFDLADVDSIELDNQTAIFRSVDYAYKMGHRDIGYLKSTTVIQNFVHHFDGYCKGLYKYNLLECNHPVIELPCTMNDAKKAMDEFLDHKPEGFQMPTLFIADLDYIAIGAMQALKEHGYRIPDDISLIGYDDIDSSTLCEPALTTTRVNHGNAGRIAMQRLAELLAKEHTQYYLTVQLSSTLVIRDSVKDLNQ